MGDWSQLPTELLNLISNHLNSDFYLLRFRSVCSTWRSSTTFPNPNHHYQKLPSDLPNPIFSNSINPNSDSTTFSLSKRTLFLISPPKNIYPHHHYSWIIKINNSNNQLLSPLSRFLPLLCSFPPVLDFNDLSVVELGHEFDLYREKVVLFQIERRFAFLTIHVSGKLAVFRVGDDRWTIIPEMSTLYDDVCVFKGKPLAVDRTVRTVSVRVGIEPELGLDLVAEPVFGGDKKYLVESNGELLLVDKHLSCVCYCSALDDGDEDDDDDDEDNGVVVGGDDYGVGWGRVLKFDVYKFDEKEKRSVKLTNLGDMSLFLGDDCAFSISCSDLGSAFFGNCVIFRDDTFMEFQFGMGLFDLDTQKTRPLQKDYRNYHGLFMPPKWARSR